MGGTGRMVEHGGTTEARQEIDLLRRLVAERSHSGKEQAAVALLVEEMRTLGYDEAFVDGAGNAVGIRGEGPRQLLLLGHIDTVPGGPPVEERAGRLYGRGTVDAKGPLAAFALAAARLPLATGWQLIVVGAVEEEAATSRGARYLIDRCQPAGVVIGEPSGWDAVTIGYKGRLLCELEAREPTAHTAGPGQGVATLAFRFWAAVETYVAEFNGSRADNRLFAQLQPSIRSIQSFTEQNEDGVRATFGFRLPPDVDPEAFSQKLSGLAPDGVTVRFRGGERAWQASRSSALARAFNGALREQGVTPRFKVKTGTSDANVVAPHWPCPIVAYGAGDSTLDHTPGEYVELEEWLRSIEVLERALARFMEMV